MATAILDIYDIYRNKPTVPPSRPAELDNKGMPIDPGQPNDGLQYWRTDNTEGSCANVYLSFSLLSFMSILWSEELFELSYVRNASFQLNMTLIDLASPDLWHESPTRQIPNASDLTPVVDGTSTFWASEFDELL